MAQQEDGWPLGLQPLNVRVGLVRNRDYSGSISFNTLLTGSLSSSTDSSSDLDTESTGSFFHDKSVTLGSLIGVSNILELSERSGEGRRAEALRNKKSCRSKTWFFSLCSRADDSSSDSVNNPPPSLGHFLEAERRATNDHRRNQSPIIYEADEFSRARNASEPTSLFVDGLLAPPQSNSNSWFDSDAGETSHGVPVLFSCMCGQPSN
ncbi:uncharacterized protein At3g17950-like [Macadamia integrifolia]|uniref:uncharacterized protein At3g17950-like n=1 Tax=Macadamia integrifolia TaxID=60698 RepID=UPI001C533A8A|nr:uncharacterized protein At3g17950-like [Macadamia integrifolia]XP_042475041.1 uncharacterized protein At3g17950-like [Macadamia integrifolia]